ncbi:MAG: hypothetical protein ACRED4_06480 [Brevundimonas sp.]
MEALTYDLMFGAGDAEMIDHIVDVVGDRMRSNDGYTEGNEETLSKLEALRNACQTKDLVCIVMLAVTAETRSEPEDGGAEPA